MAQTEPDTFATRIHEGKEETSVKGFIGDIEDMTEENSGSRRVLYTGKTLQLVLMALRPGEEICEEVHNDRDQRAF
jgi:mannose-6-phosphate isomerase-like protein (cupin superfamily)